VKASLTRPETPSRPSIWVFVVVEYEDGGTNSAFKETARLMPLMRMSSGTGRQCCDEEDVQQVEDMLRCVPQQVRSSFQVA
jgi:hypothetical protein